VPRLGELLVAAGVIGPAQLEEGLRAQVVHGARLGTNLIELGNVELDQVATALARQHNMPPALRRHFERCNPEVQCLLPRDLAARHLCVPIGYVAGDRSKVLLAMRDPVSRNELELMAVAMGLPPGGLVPAIAAELRVLFFLERSYGVARSNRFLRVRREPTETTSPGVSLDDPTGQFLRAPTESFAPPEDFHVEETPVDHLIDPPPPGASWRRPRRDSQGNEDTPAPPEVVPAAPEHPLPLGGEELRRFVETLADPQPQGSALGRIALRKRNLRAAMSQSGSGSSEVAEAAAIATLLAEARTVDDIARAVRRAHRRGRIGDLAVGALRRFGDTIEAGLMLLVRETTALGWKGYSRKVDDVAFDELAVPLDAPTVLASAVHEGRALVIDGDHGTDIDRRLWQALGKPNPGQVAVAPIVLHGHVICLLYGQSAPGTSMAPYAELFAAVQHSTSAAFARLLKAAQR
jgi:hypothetical protein